jgi:flagellar export protein FliJ
MKRFCFSLQSVATIREMRELRARENLAAAIRLCEQAEMALADARARRELLEDLVRSGRAFTLRASEHVSFLCALGAATEAESAADRGVVRAHATRDQRLSEYYEAAQNMKVIGNLETRAREVHRVACDKEEQTALDERASISAAVGRRYLS